MGPFFAQKAIQHTPEGTFAIPGASEEKLDAKKTRQNIQTFATLLFELVKPVKPVEVSDLRTKSACGYL
jgi:hypothetical protein